VALIATVAMVATETAFAGTVYENSRKSMAAGDFSGDGQADAACIKANGTIVVHDFSNGQSQTLTLPGGETASKLVAADLNGDGRAGLAVISNASQLRTYDFAAPAWTSDTSKSDLFDLSSDNADSDARDEVLAISGTSPNNSLAYVYESGSWSSSLGYLDTVTAGQFVNDTSIEFLGSERGGGNLLYKPRDTSDSFGGDWGVYESGGGGIIQVIAANILVSDTDVTDDVLMRNTGAGLYFNDHSVNHDVGKGASALDAGRVDEHMAAGQDFAYVLGYEIGEENGDGIIYQSDRWDTLGPADRWIPLPTDAWDDTQSTGAAAGNTGIDDFLVADIDGDGLDEILALKSDALYLFDNGGSGFVFVPEPAALSLVALGALTGLRRRRPGRR